MIHPGGKQSKVRIAHIIMTTPISFSTQCRSLYLMSAEEGNCCCNPQCACVARIAVVVLSVCLSTLILALQATRRPSLQKARKHTKSTRRKSEQVLYCKCGAESGLEQCHHCRPIPGVHYRMNLRDVPFLLTASTSPSHSITANYQQLLASMKCHNGLLCGAAAAAQKKKTNCFKSVTAMKALLKSLEEEFGRLTFEHQELAQKLTTRQPAAFGLSEEQLQHLADQMELKTKQIGIVSRQLGATANSRIDRPSTSVQVTCSRDANVKFLRRIKDIKTTLQENDLSWD
ncbi:Centrosomal protein of 57 kDa [Geodia barretti]|uniref:Centrosomal protein of 57 kDa n=1 Tax=Geodia barretti TaxID=519541 RepID=A0AA35WRS1_GEOBA|nr:Centrosomal protein of 57 kDa [Geodia barretti]